MQAGLVRKAFILAIAVALAPQAARALPDAATLAADLGLSPDQIAQVKAGQFVSLDLKPSSPRELTAGFAFQVGVPPAKLVSDLRAGLLRKVDPTVTASGEIHGAGSAADFAKLTIDPKTAASYASGSSDLNLSTDERAKFANLSAADVAKQVRAQLLARVTAYQAKGLDGIAPYARGSDSRSPAEDLRLATNALKALTKYEPAAHQLLLDYPAKKPAGLVETYGWSQFDAHGVPTIALTQGMFIPDGDAYLAVQRQFYVSTGYNCEQATAAFLPTTDSGTIVVYGNRTSTDQITGFGGGAKRSIGSKMLESQLEDMFQKLHTAVKQH
jgi:hypothetical protein